MHSGGRKEERERGVKKKKGEKKGIVKISGTASALSSHKFNSPPVDRLPLKGKKEKKNKGETKGKEDTFGIGELLFLPLTSNCQTLPAGRKKNSFGREKKGGGKKAKKIAKTTWSNAFSLLISRPNDPITTEKKEKVSGREKKKKRKERGDL